MKLSEFSPALLPADLDLPEEVHIAAGVAERLAEVVAQYLGENVLVVADPDTWKCVSSTGRLPAVLKKVRRHMLPRGSRCDDAAIDAVYRKSEGAEGLLAVGSGAVDDIVKTAAAHRNLPYVVLGTAASTNSYACACASMLSGGLKVAVRARPPRAILLDTEILAGAPLDLTRAGVGELISTPYSLTDWWLADRVESAGHDGLPENLMGNVVLEAVLLAPGLARGDGNAFAALARALVLSGLTMAVTGGNTPACGGEHLLSHLWDMESLAAGRQLRLHGAQTGVASCISAALYHRLAAVAAPRIVEPHPWEKTAALIQRELGDLADIVLEAAERKHARQEKRLAVLRGAWPAVRAEIAARNLPGPAVLHATLASIGAPGTLAELGLERKDAARALRIACNIRDRYTVLDLALDLGILPDAIDAVLDEAGV